MPSIPDVRINARLTGRDAQRFAELLEREGVTASELLRNALREYHMKHAAPDRDVAGLLARHGFLAGGDGPEDLSSNYKTYLTGALDDKYPHRVNDK
jgi:hypothetical protein